MGKTVKTSDILKAFFRGFQGIKKYEIADLCIEIIQKARWSFDEIKTFFTR